MNLMSLLGAQTSAFPNLGVDGVADRVLMREVMEELHRCARSLPKDEFERLIPLAMCMFALCLRSAPVDWLSPPKIRSLLSGSRDQMFEWLDDVFSEEFDVAAG